MLLKIELALDNAAFDDAAEIERVLRVVARDAGNVPLRTETEVRKVRDLNGNSVCRWEITNG